MPRAQVLVTVTAEALIDVPADVVDVADYCREHLELAWGGLNVEGTIQPPTFSVEHYIVPEPEPEPELVAEAESGAASGGDTVDAGVASHDVEGVDLGESIGAAESPFDTLPLPAVRPALDLAASGPQPAEDLDLVALFDDPAYKAVIRSAIRARAERLLEDVVGQVVAELEPLLERHIAKNAGKQ